LKYTDVTFAPFGLTVPERVAPFAPTFEAAPVDVVGALGVVKDCSTPHGEP